MSNENASGGSNFEIYLKTPSNYEAAVRVALADIPAQTVGDHTVEGVAAMAAYMTRLDAQLAKAGFTRSERLDKPARGGGGRPQPSPTIVNEDGEMVEAKCPKCGGAVWDNRTSKTNPKAPDFKCKNKECGGATWLKREAA